MILLALYLFFQPNRNPLHPDIHIRLTQAERVKINTAATSAAKEKVEMDLIKLHQPPSDMRAECADTEDGVHFFPHEGYRGRHEFASEITYTWETPRCSAK